MSASLPHREHVDILIAGAGITGLATAAWLRELHPTLTVQIIEREAEPGGFCRTIEQDGFVWDYSGHFFHFRKPEIGEWVHREMPVGELATIERRSLIRFGDALVNFPFQLNLHELPYDDFIACLSDLYHAQRASNAAAAGAPTGNFYDMLFTRYGRGIAERFLIPYNEKLYGCDLRTLDAGAMGRFFPHVSFDDVMARLAQHAKAPSERARAGYNATFSYAKSGAQAYVRALQQKFPASWLSCNEALLEVDVEHRIATTSKRQLSYGRLVSSLPLPHLLRATRADSTATAPFVANRVLVYNLGFDSKGPEDVHWLYVPDRDACMYRIGFYDNIFGDSRMSLYVEIGLPPDANDSAQPDLGRVLADLTKLGVVTNQKLISHAKLVLSPAYCHISQGSEAESERLRALWATQGLHSLGRYGEWTYCSMEDNMISAHDLVRSLAPADNS